MNKKSLKNAIIMATMVLFVPTMATAQVTIGGGQSPRATLDVRKMTGSHDLPQGIIPPQITFAELQALEGNYVTTANTQGAGLNGAIVFVTYIPTPHPAVYHPIMTYVVAPGLYFFDYGTGTDTRRWRPIVPPVVAPYMIVAERDGANTAALINAALLHHDRIYVSLYGPGNPGDITLVNGLRKGQTITVANRAASSANFSFRGLSQTSNTGIASTQSVAGNRGAQFIWVPGVQGGCLGHWMYVL